MILCGKKQNPNIHGLSGLSVKELKKVKLLYPYITNIHKYKRAELCNLLAKNCESLGGLINKSNSCYLDSILIALFHNINPYIYDEILKKPVHFNNDELQNIAREIQKLLRTVYNSISKGVKGFCVRLRNSFEKFDKIYSKVYNVRLEDIDWKSEQLEPKDVINILIKIFKIPDDCYYKIQTYGIKNRKKF